MHAGQTTLSVSSTHGEQQTARRVYVRIARFFARLREKAEQLEPLGLGRLHNPGFETLPPAGASDDIISVVSPSPFDGRDEGGLKIAVGAGQ